jgi:hypothetical protein
VYCIPNSKNQSINTSLDRYHMTPFHQWSRCRMTPFDQLSRCRTTPSDQLSWCRITPFDDPIVTSFLTPPAEGGAMERRYSKLCRRTLVFTLLI